MIKAKILSMMLVAILLVSPSFVMADPIADIYQIEVIVFEHTDPNRFKVENWPKFVAKIDHKNSVNLDKLKDNLPESIDTLEVLDALDDAGEVPVKEITRESINLVAPKNYLLSKEIKMVQNSKDKTFIKHIAWNQPLANNVKSTPVYFTGGDNQQIASIISIKPNRNVFNVNVETLYKLRPDDKQYALDIEEIKINRDVRLKKREAFYVDHPIIGMIIIISPVIYGNTSYSPLPNL